VTKFTVSAIASQRLDEIFAYTRDNWGVEEAEVYIRGLFGCFDQIGRQQIVGRAISAEFGMEGYYHRHECQSACKRDPLSARKRDPLFKMAQG
jgi:toxin ParE1/3/4